MGVAAALGVSQSAISKIERRDDVSVTALRDYIAALGGEVDIVARFPDGAVPITVSATRYSQRAPLRKVAERPAFVMPEDWAVEVVRIRAMPPDARMEEVANLSRFYAGAKRRG